MCTQCRLQDDFMLNIDSALNTSVERSQAECRKDSLTINQMTTIFHSYSSSKTLPITFHGYHSLSRAPYLSNHIFIYSPTNEFIDLYAHLQPAFISPSPVGRCESRTTPPPARVVVRTETQGRGAGAVSSCRWGGFGLRASALVWEYTTQAVDDRYVST